MTFTKKSAFIATGIFVAAATAATALAFWTTTGSGSTSSKAATVGNLTVAVTLADGSHPGDGPTGAAITGTVTNGTTSAISVSQVAGDPANVATHYLTVDSAHSTCVLTDFTLQMDPIVGAPVTLAANGGSTPFTGRLVMAESGANQNACQGAVLTVHLVAS